MHFRESGGVKAIEVTLDKATLNWTEPGCISGLDAATLPTVLSHSTLNLWTEQARTVQATSNEQRSGRSPVTIDVGATAILSTIRISFSMHVCASYVNAPSKYTYAMPRRALAGADTTQPRYWVSRSWCAQLRKFVKDLGKFATNQPKPSGGRRRKRE